jgi:type VI secretion system protein ImpJ
MDPVARLLWSEGLHLMPEHLQQLDRVHAGAVAALWREAAPFRWGFARLSLREGALARGVVEVASLAAVTREGVFLAADPTDWRRCNARLRPLALPAGSVLGPTMVYLCLARELDGVPRVATPAELASGERLVRRHLAEDWPCGDADDVRRLDEVSVTRLPYLLQLGAVPEGPPGDTLRAALARDFDILPMARLLPQGEAVVLDEGFVPPALSLGAAPRLRARAADLADRMIGRIAEIEPEIGTRRLQAEVGVPQNLAVFLVLRSLHAHASAILQATELADTHPAELYFRLRQAVADLAAFRPGVSLRGEIAAGADLPARGPLLPYAHDDLGARVQQAVEVLDLLIAGLGTGGHLSVELQHIPPSSWAARIPPEFFEGRITRYFLLVESVMPASEVELRLRQRKIATAAELPALIDSNLFGLRTERRVDPPPGLPTRAGRYTYFEVDTTDIYWQRIRTQGDIRIFCPELAREEVRIRLYREATPG